MKFIHLSDTHVVGAGQLLYGTDPARRLRRAVDSINAEHADASFAIVTGDMTHWGDAAAYAAFRSEIDRLKVTVHLMVGNHDDTVAFASAFPDAPRDPSGFAQCTFATPHGTAICLDTKSPGTHAGGYCADRCNWLAGRLASIDGPVLLFMHHPPFEIGIPAMDAIMLQDKDRFAETIAPHADRIRHLFFGHAHRAIFGSWRGIPFSCMRGTNHQVALDLDGDPTRIGGDLADPAYGVVLVSDDQITVHLHCFADKNPKFSLVAPAGQDQTDYSLDMRHADFHDL